MPIQFNALSDFDPNSKAIKLLDLFLTFKKDWFTINEIMAKIDCTDMEARCIVNRFKKMGVIKSNENDRAENESYRYIYNVGGYEGATHLTQFAAQRFVIQSLREKAKR